jgi:hypothetical protein
MTLVHGWRFVVCMLTLTLLLVVVAVRASDGVMSEEEMKNMVLPTVACHPTLCDLKQGCE